MAERRISECRSVDRVEETDTILVVEDVEILVHRNTLSTLSPYFECLLMGDFKEKSETRIELKEVKLDTFTECLDIMLGVDLKYTPGEMDLDRLNNLLTYADRFDIAAVRMFCQWEMNFHSPGQEVDRYLLACQHTLPDHTKNRLLSFVTSSALSAWSENNMSVDKSSVFSLNNTDLAQLIAVCKGVPHAHTSIAVPSDVPPNSTNVRLADTFVDVGGDQFPVNKAIMCHLSSYFYSRFAGLEDKLPEGAILHLGFENVKADVFRDCMNIIYGKPVSNYSPGSMASSRLLDLLDLSTRLSLSQVRVFCSIEMQLPSKGMEFERYLLACHFSLSQCKATLLPRLSRSILDGLDFVSIASQLTLDKLSVDVDDIRSLLSVAVDVQNSSAIANGIYTSTAVPTFVSDSSEFLKKSAISDVVLLAGSSEFHVNRMMMGSVSEHFRKILVDEGQDKSEFVVEHVDASLFALCLHIMHGRMPKTYKRGELSSRCMIGLLEYAHRFELAHVKLFCEHEIFKYEGHEMDRFLVSGVHFPDETESLLSNLTVEKIVNWLERRVADGFPLAPCLISLTISQLGRLIKLVSIGKLFDEKSGVHISPSPSSLSPERLASSSTFLTVTNNGTLHLLIDFSHCGAYSVPSQYRYLKLAPGESSRVALGLRADHTSISDPAMRIKLRTVSAGAWQCDATTIRDYYCTPLTSILFPFMR